MPIHHVVMFKLAGGDNGPSAAAIDPLIQTLVAGSPGVLSHEIRHDAGLRPNGPRSYHRLIHYRFADGDAFKTYLACDAHQAFLAAIPELVESIAALQYDGD